MTDYGFYDRAESVRYEDTGYVGRYHIVLWSEANQTGNPYHADNDVPDLGGAHRNHIRSIEIYKKQPPNANQTAPADGASFPTDNTSVDLSFSGGSEYQLHVWSSTYNQEIDWQTAQTATVSNLTPGIYSWQVQARNNVGTGQWSAVRSFTINTPPQINGGGITVAEGATQEIQIQATDAENDSLSLTAASVPGFATFTDEGSGIGTLSMQPASGTAGEYPITITANDGHATAAAIVTVTVEGGSPTPTQTPTISDTTFEDFEGGITNWWTNGNISHQTEGTNGFIRFVTPDGGDAESSKDVTSAALADYQTISLRINLHGVTLLGNDASALYLDQGGWKYVSLSDYVQQGVDGWQTVSIPVSDFPGFDKAQPFNRLGFRFWTDNSSTIDVDDITFVTEGGSATPDPTPTTSSTPTSSPTQEPTPTASSVELLPSPWNLVGDDGAAELYQSIDPSILQGKTTMRITYDLHGIQALGGDASAIIFDQGGWKFVSLSDYGQNGLDGEQTVEIPLSDFSGLDLSGSTDGTLHTRFWYSSAFTVDITSIQVY